MKKYMILLVCALTLTANLYAQTGNPKKIEKLERKLKNYFDDYKAPNNELERQPKMLNYKLNESERTLVITADEVFAQQNFTPKTVEKIYKKISHAIPSPYDDYQLTVITNGMKIEELIPNRLSNNADSNRTWKNIQYKGEPWVKNVSQPHSVTHGLQNRHLSLWASHGRYYDQQKSTWKWQRPNLFCTTEDLFTQTVVVPYLIPMLEKAGAVVFTPRERDWQRHEIIVDNDNPTPPYYKEVNLSRPWENTTEQGFAFHEGTYSDGENPFVQGTARMAKASSKKAASQLVYQPDIPESGKYAVYVSYQTLPNSIDNAQYIVYHKGQETTFHVNQQMGGGTWVYLGTFDFDKGCNEFNRVVLTNYSKKKGVVTGDAVRFGGGMGNIVRGGTTSGFPRCLEGARYYAQWAGAPRDVSSASNGKNDYNDDVNARSLMTNWLSGGSCFLPGVQGKHVPLEMSLAVHSDAGVRRDDTFVGTLSICTTSTDGKTVYPSGISRMASRDLADALISGVHRDLSVKYGNWVRRALWDRNYSETRRPEVPSSILEMLSHQNFTDMRYGLDPNFRFTMARSIYKSLLRYVSQMHNSSYIVQPLQPKDFRLTFTSKGKVTLRWTPVNDPQEPTARPTSYVVYTATGTSGFDNGTVVSSPHYTVELEPNVLYHFRVTACNRGGESFPTEVLCAAHVPNARKTVVIVNGFHRLSGPAVVNTETRNGFDMNEDAGVTYGRTAGWSGAQLCFNREQMGKEGAGALGFCGDELAGKFIAGNDFNYVSEHAAAIHSAGLYNIVSCSSTAVENGSIDLADYQTADLLLGLEKDDGHSLVAYKTFTPVMQQRLTNYIRKGGRLLVSGSYVGSDMTTDSEKQFLADVLKVNCDGNNREDHGSQVSGLGVSFNIYNSLNERHYAATSPDVLLPVAPAYCAMQYSNGRAASVAYKGNDYRCLTTGFPLECIMDATQRNAIMRGILSFLME